MKKFLLPSICSVLLSFGANAAVNNSSSNSKLPNPPAYGTSSGLTLNILMGLSGDITGSGSITGTANLSSSNAFGIGFQQITIGAMGFSAGIDFENYSIEEGGEVESTTIYANANYGMSEKAYGFGGINFPNWKSSGDANVSSEMGYQIGFGFKATPNFGLELIKRQTTAKSGTGVGEAVLDFDSLSVRGSLMF